MSEQPKTATHDVEDQAKQETQASEARASEANEAKSNGTATIEAPHSVAKVEDPCPWLAPTRFQPGRSGNPGGKFKDPAKQRERVDPWIAIQKLAQFDVSAYASKIHEILLHPEDHPKVYPFVLKEYGERILGKVEQRIDKTSTVQRVVISASLAQPIAQLQTPQHTSEIEKREVGSGTMQDDIATLPASSDCSGSMSSDVSLLTSELSKRVVMLEQSQRDILAAQEKTMEMLRSLLPR